MSSQMRCPDCESYEIDYDPARGDAACIDCGTVLEQNLIVNEVAFAEDARGRSSMVGQTLRADGQSFSVLPGFSRQATELTMQNGRRRLAHLTSALKLKSRHSDAALRLFKLGVERNFHRGRRMANVCCACLYIVCRIEKTPHMLLDFADVLETNVYVLGHTFLKFAQLLSIQLPIIDPSLYIHRFASKLEFGQQAQAVANSALRIMARMQRDWINDGRRPSGLCGAALLLAARMHDFFRTQGEVARVVRIGNVVLRERLQELDRTPTAGMTVKEIEAGGGGDGKMDSLTTKEEACDPPAFQRLQKKKGRDVEVEEVQRIMQSEEMQELEREGREAQNVWTGQQENENGGKDGEGAEKGDNDQAGDGEKDNDGAEKEGEKEGEQVDEEDDGELSELDEKDLERYLNTEEEYERKKELWTEVNKDYLEKQERLERMKRERPEEYKRLRPTRTPTKKRTREPKASRQADSDDEPPSPPKARRQSKKLNYSVLKTLDESGMLGTTQPT